MSTKAIGTNATTSLTYGLKFLPGYGSGMSAADIATICAHIKDDVNVAHPLVPNSFGSNGILYVPNRGQLKMLPGDYVAVDPTTGWPILISKYAAASGPWTIAA